MTLAAMSCCRCGTVGVPTGVSLASSRCSVVSMHSRLSLVIAGECGNAAAVVGVLAADDYTPNPCGQIVGVHERINPLSTHMCMLRPDTPSCNTPAMQRGGRCLCQRCPLSDGRMHVLIRGAAVVHARIHKASHLDSGSSNAILQVQTVAKQQGAIVSHRRHVLCCAVAAGMVSLNMRWRMRWLMATMRAACTASRRGRARRTSPHVQRRQSCQQHSGLHSGQRQMARCRLPNVRPCPGLMWKECTVYCSGL